MDAEPLTLRDGSTVATRPVEPGDEHHIREIWDGMSELSRRRRFLAPTNEVSDEDMRYLVEVDHKRHEALIALDDGDRCVGVARYVRVPGDRTAAEVAVVVADAWHRRGLGTALMLRLSERARENGIDHYTAIVASDNDVVLDALDRAGATRTAVTDEQEVEFSLPLPPDGLGDRLSAALRAAAERPREFLGAVVRRLPVWRWHP